MILYNHGYNNYEYTNKPKECYVFLITDYRKKYFNFPSKGPFSENGLGLPGKTKT